MPTGDLQSMGSYNEPFGSDLTPMEKKISYKPIVVIVLKQTDMLFEVAVNNRVFKCKATIEAGGLHVVGTKAVEHTHEGNLSCITL